MRSPLTSHLNESSTSSAMQLLIRRYILQVRPPSQDLVHSQQSLTNIQFGQLCFQVLARERGGSHHARVIQTILNATNNVNTRRKHNYRTVCIASDGEAKRGDALMILTMSSRLSASSPFYELLSSLKFMNHLIGPDDITPDKDFKHVFKCQRNLLKHHKGVLIQGFCVTPAILQTHLESNGVPPH